MNKVQLVGRLARDIELRYSQGANPVAVGRTCIAVNRRFKKQGEADADFINLLMFGKTAENMEKYIKKGRMVAVAGHIRTGSYDKDGQKVFTFEVVVDEFSFCDSNNATQANTTPTNTTNTTQVIEEYDDLPF